MVLARRAVESVTDESIWKRIAWMYASFFVLLVPVTVLSYLLLPEGILRGRHPIISALELSPVLWVCTLQIFAYNLVFALVVVGANLIARQLHWNLVPRGRHRGPAAPPEAPSPL